MQDEVISDLISKGFVLNNPHISTHAKEVAVINAVQRKQPHLQLDLVQSID